MKAIRQQKFINFKALTEIRQKLVINLNYYSLIIMHKFQSNDINDSMIFTKGAS